MPNIINIPLYFTSITINNIYTELAPKLSATASVAQWQSTGLVIQMTLVRFPAGRPWSFATGPDLGLIMYILKTLEFPKT